MKANKLSRNVYGLLGLFIVTLFFFTPSANAQTLASAGSASTETVSVSSPDLAKGVMHGEDMYVAKNGTIFKKGDKIQLGAGTTNSGRFKSIPILYNKPSQDDILLPPSYAGQQVEIKALKQFKVGSGKDAPLATYAVIKVEKHDTHAINIEHALLIKEIVIQ